MESRPSQFPTALSGREARFRTLSDALATLEATGAPEERRWSLSRPDQPKDS